MTPLEKSLKRGMKRGTFLRSSLFFVSIWYSFRLTDVAMQASMLADVEPVPKVQKCWGSCRAAAKKSFGLASFDDLSCAQAAAHLDLPS